MRLLSSPRLKPRRLGILPGSFNPPTRAHVALARSALGNVDQVVFVLPEMFPHKAYEGASLEHRVAMLQRIAAPDPGFAAALSNRGLFIDIAREAREHYPDAEQFFLCGRDAAERIIEWDYGDPGAIDAMLREFQLLVAPRNGIYTPPARLAHAVHALSLSDYDECSATCVRQAIAQGQNWRELVPDEIADIVARVYL